MKMLRSDLHRAPEQSVVATPDRLIVAVKVSTVRWSVTGYKFLFYTQDLIDLVYPSTLESIEIPEVSGRQHTARAKV
jgi:hypothetical protein